MSDDLRIGIIGHRFMGAAHANAWLQASHFFDLPATPVLQLACGRDQEALAGFARRWGWRETCSDWRDLIASDAVDVVDISLPTAMHAEIAIAAAEAGKHVFCEKPMALNREQAEAMLAAAEANGTVCYLNHNYRRAPAVMLARQLIDEERIGRIFHWRACYQQDWIVDPDFPLTWHLQADQAGAGPHADLNSHSVDLAHFLVGAIEDVSCTTTTFIAERPLPGAGAATFSPGAGGAIERGAVTVEDAALMQVRFANGALGSFEATRFATGSKNRNCFEIYGSEGSLRFDLERMNELEFFSRSDPDHAQGFRTILATEACHPFVEAWWPPGHIIGYEHTFTHAMADFVRAVRGGAAIAPDFRDGLAVIAVLDAGLESARNGHRVTVQHAGAPVGGAA